jgi:hypothetical protein
MDELVLTVAKACWRADMIDRAESEGRRVPDTFDFEWGWSELSTMPLSGPGFIREWTVIARAALQAAGGKQDA